MRKSLAVSRISFTFAGVMMLAFDDNKVISTVQRNFDFSASFNAYYLVNPNNLLTHTGASSV